MGGRQLTVGPARTSLETRLLYGREWSGFNSRLCTYIQSFDQKKLLSLLSRGISLTYHSQRHLEVLKLCINVSGHIDMTTLSILVIIIRGVGR